MQDLPAHRAAGEIGMVFQHPGHQIVMENTLQELVFGMENLGFSSELMRRRAAETTAYLGLEKVLSRPTESLSGGQKQLLNLASVLALRPRLLLLDEPTGHLDPVAAVRFLHTVKRLNEETGMTVIFTEHRLEEAYPLADRVLVMNQGKLCFNGLPREGVRWMKESGPGHRDLIPAIPSLILQTGGSEGGALPLTVKEGRKWLQERENLPFLSFSDPPRRASSFSPRQPLLSLRRVDFRYAEETVLKQTTFDIFTGECVAIFGGNGSGKSTLLKVMAGLLPPNTGSIRYRGRKWTRRVSRERIRRIGYLPQNPESYFLHETVEAELQAASRQAGEERRERCREVISGFSLTPFLSRHPHDLSGGEMQKVALACLLLRDLELLLLDEPTKGVDPECKSLFSRLLKSFAEQGKTVVLTTHDVEFAAVTATRCSLLFDGEILASGTVGSFFRENDFYTTAVYRMTRDTGVPEAVTVEEAVRLWQGQSGRSVLS
ncbi:putative ABC transporter ATP-binding protein [Kroppenstedtia guangzhouensis]|uniref:ABC transporter ATP-binding protein n=1 Tax=Kroppenstedtia guangzhouensis TaxID=1274356 RepID=A0ABQ1FZR6_9BACL|nr:putative ABC transporter ATP-binding protein [Kroppenstedtia guangzhouensis]